MRPRPLRRLASAAAVLTLAGAAAPQAGGPPRLVRGPIVQNPRNDPTTAALVWYTDLPSAGQVEWGRSEEYGHSLDGGVGTRHEHALEGLTPGALYHYRVLADGTTAATGSFVALPTADQPVRLVVIGDFGRDLPENDRAAASVAALRPRPHALLTVGDNVYTNGVQPYIDSRWLTRWARVNSAMFVLPTWGNHDYQVDEARQQREIFALPENGFDERWWRLDAGPVTVLGLDSNWFRKPVAEWPRQNDWMRAQIEASAAPWKLALYHHSQARCGDDARGAGQIRKHWMPTMEAHQVHAIAGHAHTYSRIWTDRHPADGHGIWQLTVGRTGQPSDPRPPYVVPTPPPPALPTPCVPDAGFAAASWRNAYLVVDADSTSLKFTLVDADDRTAVDRLALRR